MHPNVADQWTTDIVGPRVFRRGWLLTSRLTTAAVVMVPVQTASVDWVGYRATAVDRFRVTCVCEWRVVLGVRCACGCMRVRVRVLVFVYARLCARTNVRVWVRVPSARICRRSNDDRGNGGGHRRRRLRSRRRPRRWWQWCQYKCCYYGYKIFNDDILLLLL